MARNGRDELRGNGVASTVVDADDSCDRRPQGKTRRQTEDMRVQIRVLDSGTRVRVRHPRRCERGEWRVTGRVLGSGLTDPAYDVQHLATGRFRIFRRSRLAVLRASRRPTSLMHGNSGW